MGVEWQCVVVVVVRCSHVVAEPVSCVGGDNDASGERNCRARRSSLRRVEGAVNSSVLSKDARVARSSSGGGDDDASGERGL